MRSISFKLAAILLLSAGSFAQQLNIDTQVKGSRWPAFGTDSGAANAYVVTTVAPLGPGLRAGTRIIFFAANSNTSASTLNADSTGIKTIKKWTSGAQVDLASGDITAGQPVEVIYDGSTFYNIVGLGGGSSSSGAGIKVNGSAIPGTNANLSDSTPAAASNHVNVTWQKDTTTPDTNISAQVAAATDTVLGAIKSKTCTNQFYRSITTGTGVPNCDTVGTPDLAANAVNSAKLAVVNTYVVCMMDVGADNGPLLVDADLGLQKRLCFIPIAAHVLEITVTADAGTPNVLLERRRGASTLADLLSGALATAASGNVACARSATSATCIDGTTSSGSITTSNTALNAGDYIELKSGTAGGTAKSMQIAVTLTID